MQSFGFTFQSWRSNVPSSYSFLLWYISYIADTLLRLPIHGHHSLCGFTNIISLCYFISAYILYHQCLIWNCCVTLHSCGDFTCSHHVFFFCVILSCYFSSNFILCNPLSIFGDDLQLYYFVLHQFPFMVRIVVDHSLFSNFFADLFNLSLILLEYIDRV